VFFVVKFIIYETVVFTKQPDEVARCELDDRASRAVDNRSNDDPSHDNRGSAPVAARRGDALSA
jgi:hypothetical protein